MKLYISDLSLMVLAIFYLPLVVLVLWRVVRSQKLTGLKKVFGLLGVVILAYAIPLGDVTLNSIAMTKACQKVGVHIYKTARVEGYFDSLGSEDFFRHRPGFRFVEYKRPGEIVRLERRDLEIVKSILPAPTAEYEVLLGEWAVDKEKRVEVSRDLIRHRASGEVLAERLIFNPMPGWVDRLVMVRWFGEFMPGCREVPPISWYAFQEKVLSSDSRNVHGE